MNANIIDRLNGITRSIDSGIGLLGPWVDHLVILLVAFDVILAGWLWLRHAERGRLAPLARRTVWIGALVIILWDPSFLTLILANSFTSLGLGPVLSAGNFVQPGHLVQAGIDASRTLLAAANELQIVSLSDHFVQVVIFLIAASTVLAVYFIVAVRLFAALLVFKLSALAGFVHVPFGLCGRGGDRTERMLGAVVDAAIKVLVLTVIVGLGTILTGQIAQRGNASPSTDDAMMQMLGSLALLTLGLFGSERICGLIRSCLLRSDAAIDSALQHRPHASHLLAATTEEIASPVRAVDSVADLTFATILRRDLIANVRPKATLES